MTETRASIRSLETQIGKLATLMFKSAQGNLLSTTEFNPKEQCQAITLRSGIRYEGPKKNLSEEEVQKGNTQGIDKEKSNEEKVTEDLSKEEEVPPVSIEHHEILSNKRKMGDYETVALTEECSVILQRKLPQKLRNPGSFTIPCTIGEFECKHALCDLGASINIMPLSVFRRLGLGEARTTTVTLQLADRSVKHPRGII
ncbi:uncharacterized protein LOC133785147 [Humulus lupulus]|uniref:uncharacterized protein LOC133785147 n=1 Tax=Humulus lupulus TaxID=3486 RepID=UPI002B405F82|nr:uncharacterized protein LOC133785147 [Humulus lupulus]